MYILLYLESYEKVSQTAARGKSPSIHLHNDHRFHLAEEATCLDSDCLAPASPSEETARRSRVRAAPWTCGRGTLRLDSSTMTPRSKWAARKCQASPATSRRLSTGRWSVVAICRSPLMGVGHMELISCYKSHVRLFVFRVVYHPPSASERRLC